MFDYLYEWIQNIAFYLIMITAVMHLIPNPEYKRYIRFFTGLVLVVMLTAPLLKLMGMEGSWRELYETQEYQRQLKKMEEAAKYLNGNSEVTETDGLWTEAEDGNIEIEDIQIER